MLIIWLLEGNDLEKVHATINTISLGALEENKLSSLRGNYFRSLNLKSLRVLERKNGTSVEILDTVDKKIESLRIRISFIKCIANVDAYF